MNKSVITFICDYADIDMPDCGVVMRLCKGQHTHAQNLELVQIKMYIFCNKCNTCVQTISDFQFM